MGRKLHGITGEQWDWCRRCAKYWPMSKLTMQLGLLICLPDCFDELDVNQRSRIIQEALSEGIDQEGADRRLEDWAWLSTTPDREIG